MQFLHYLKKAHHPQYKDLVVPSLEVLTEELEEVSRRATQAAENHDDAILQCMEQQMEDTRDGASTILHPPQCTTSNAHVLQGISDLVQGVAPSDLPHQRGASDSQSHSHEADDVQQDLPADLPHQTQQNSQSHSHEADDVQQDLPAQIQEQQNIHIQSDLLNEFHENHNIIGGLFPMEFSLGLPSQFAVGQLPEHVIRRLMGAYIPCFEQCSELIFFLFNQLTRHSASRSVAYQAKSGTGQMRKFQDLLQKKRL